jgi:hypothetical protein
LASTTEFSGGLQVPVQIDGRGGLRLLTADEYILQLIRTKVGSSESDNPFQKRSLGSHAIFRNSSDIVWQAQQRKEIEKVFEALAAAKLAKLKTLVLSRDPNEEGSFMATITYLSMETGTDQDATLALSRG